MVEHVLNGHLFGPAEGMDAGVDNQPARSKHLLGVVAEPVKRHLVCIRVAIDSLWSLSLDSMHHLAIYWAK